MRDPSLAPVVLALRAAPTERELDGAEPALAAFRAQVVQQRTGARRRAMFATAVGAKLGATLGGVAAGLAGVTTVVLVSANASSGPPVQATPPTPAQARPAAVSTTTGAPAGTATEKGPDANGPAKHGLCTAWKARSKHGNQGGADRSVAYQNLVEAAGGADKLAAFCADVPAPGAAAKHGNGAGGSSDKGAGKPTAKPSKSKAGKTTGKGDDSSTESTEPTEPTEPTESPESPDTEDSPATPGTSPHSSTGTPVPPRATPGSSATTIP